MGIPERPPMGRCVPYCEMVSEKASLSFLSTTQTIGRVRYITLESPNRPMVEVYTPIPVRGRGQFEGTRLSPPVPFDGRKPPYDRISPNPPIHAHRPDGNPWDPGPLWWI